MRDTVELLCGGKNIGWFQGRSEFGPRALGQRSIVCDPRRPDGKDELNLRVKHREAFRPFAPVILEEESPQWFEWSGSPSESQYMLRVAKFREERCNDVPAVVHVDGTGRVQTTTPEANGAFHALVKRFYEKTGVPILLNTSFNVMGMPIVETPADALYCFQATGLDYCILGNTIVKKRDKILLGPDPFAEEDMDGYFLSPENANQTDGLLKVSPGQRTPGSNGQNEQSNQASEYSFDQYVGEFEHVTGRLTITVEKQQLTGTFRGMTSPLERYSGNVFVATGALFKGSVVSFLINAEGVVDRVSVLVPAILEETGEAIFTRVPDDKAIRQELSARFLGRYELATEAVEVSINTSGNPIITAPGQPEYELKPVTDTKFDLKNTPGYQIEFMLNDSGEAVAIAVIQPNGTFTLKKTAPHAEAQSTQAAG